MRAGKWLSGNGRDVIEMPRGLWTYRFGDQLVTVHGPGTAPEPPQTVRPGTSHLAFIWPGPIAEAVQH